VGAYPIDGLGVFLYRDHNSGSVDKPPLALESVVDTHGRGVPRLLRDRLEIWASGRGGREFARMLLHPEAVAAFRTLGAADFDGQDWRRALGALARLGGKAAAAPEKKVDRMASQGSNRVGKARSAARSSAPERDVEPRAQRAEGGALVGRLNKSADAARKEIARDTRPLMAQPDEAIAHALKLANRLTGG
jgi:hypothetical protein